MLANECFDVSLHRCISIMFRLLNSQDQERREEEARRPHYEVLCGVDCTGSTEDVCKMRAIVEKDPEALERSSGDPSQSPLARAVVEKHFNCVECLLSLGADPNAQDTPFVSCYGKTALHFAIHHETTDIAELLLKNRANPNFDSLISNTHYILIACRISAFRMVKLLLDYGADTEDISSIEWAACCVNSTFIMPTPLAVATSEGDLKIMKLLLLYGAIANVGNFPIDESVIEGVGDNLCLPLVLVNSCTKPVEVKIKVLHLLYQFGGDDFWRQDTYGNTALNLLTFNNTEEDSILAEEYKNIVNNPLSLQSLSRLAIKRSMPKKYINHLKELPQLPPQVMNFLHFSDVCE